MSAALSIICSDADQPDLVGIGIQAVFLATRSISSVIGPDQPEGPFAGGGQRLPALACAHASFF